LGARRIGDIAGLTGLVALGTAVLNAEVGEAARPVADGAGERAVALPDNDAAVDWLRGHLAAGDVVLVKASREARLDKVAAALA
jgi:UDP-N-acetylmuramoyl-tripeptide--D-alanyl-D-alanine ligase